MNRNEGVNGLARASVGEREPGFGFVLGSSAVVASLSLLTLVGWGTKSPRAASLWFESIPMAPNTALCFLALTAALMLRAGYPARWGGVARVCLAFTAALALLALAPSAPLEVFSRDTVFGAHGMFGEFPLAVMSPVTAVLFVALSGALALQSLGNGPRIGQGSAILALAVSAIGLVVVLGYAFGAPLFQEGGLIIPLAFPTGLAFILLGAGTVAAAGAQIWPVSALSGAGVRARLLRAFLPITASIVLAVAWLAIWIALSHRGNPAVWTAGLASLSLCVVVFVVSGLSARIAGVLEASELARGVALERQVAAEYRANTILACADEGILGLDTGGRISFVNPAAQALLGGKSELIGQAHELILHVQAGAEGQPAHALDVLEENCGVCECLRTGKSFRAARAQFKSRMGTKLQVAYSNNPILEGGQVTGSVLTFSDLTDQQNLEQQLRQSQKMEAIGLLAGGVAHDFNNLLTAILGFSEFARSELEPEHPAQADIQEIQRAGERAATLTRQLLAFSRQQPEAPELLDLNVILAEMEKMLRRVIGENIQLVSMSDPDLTRIKADRGHIEQVIMNLAVNARDAMPKGGKLTLETGNVQLDETYVRGHLQAKPGAYAMLAITDTGVGMDPATCSRIFEPFFTTKEAGKGTGLGLATVYGILRQNEGDILVYSAPGRGTTFKLLFPRAERQVEPEPLTASLKLPKSGHETVLVVEDEEAVRIVAIRALQAAGFRALSAASPEDALALVNTYQGAIHVLVVDVVMPEMDGPELVRRVTKVLPDIRILFMSGYTGGALTHHGVLTSNVGYIPKPFTPEAFVVSVRAAIDGSPSRSHPPGAIRHGS